MPPHFRFLGLRNVLLLGYGMEGKMTRAYLWSRYRRLQVGIADASHGAHYLEKQSAYDFAVKTPGMPKRLVTIPYTTATNLFFSHLHGSEPLVIGVTGSKGKSTTASLIGALFKAGGHRVRVLGNIGVPMLEALRRPIRDDDILVVELSSYQLEDARFSPHVAVVPNLFPEHLPYHETIDAYYAAKQRIIAAQRPHDVFIYNPRDARLRGWARDATGRSLPWDNALPISRKDLPLLGEHNAENAKAAVAVARLFGVSTADIRRGFKTFRPLPHRMELVGERHGVRYYDDSKGTNVGAVAAALDGFPRPVVLIAGGRDKGGDYGTMIRALEKCARAVVLIGEATPIIETAFARASVRRR
jgi:UDP-N-acetylmuramoylalanine--D-glutamate ligase